MPEVARKFKEILLKPQNSLFILTGTLIILISVAVYFLMGKQASDVLVEQMLNREQTASKAGAVSLGVFMNSFSNQTSTHSTRPAIISFDPQNAPKDLEIFMDRWKGTAVSGLILVDRNGIVKFGQDRFGTTGEGIDVSEREYFKWAKTAKEGEVYIVEPFQSKIGFTTDKFVVSAVTPIIKNGQFNGAFVTGFLLDEAANSFLNPLKITDNTRIYLIDQNGVILSGPVQKLVGTNYLDYLGMSGVDGGGVLVNKLKDILASKEGGKLDIALPDENRNGILTRYLIGYSPVLLGNQHWLLVVSTPASDALSYLTPFYFKQIGIVSLAFLGFLIIAMRIAKVVGYGEAVKAEHIEHGINQVDRNKS